MVVNDDQASRVQENGTFKPESGVKMMTSQFESLDLMERMLPSRLARPTRRQRQAGPVPHATQLGGHQQDLAAEGLQRGCLKLRRKAEPLEPVHQVVGQQEQMEVGCVGEEVPRGDAAQGIIPFELLDQQLHAGPVVVKAPEVERLQRQVGDQHLVVILAKLEERQLRGRLLRLRSSHDDEAIRMRPAGRLRAELGDLDSTTRGGVPEVRQLAFDRGRQASDDHKPGPPGFEPLDQRVVVKPFVRADNHQSDSGGNLREAGGEEVACPAGRMDIARPQFPMPEVFAPALEAEQGVIRRSPTLDRVVADLGVFLVAVEHEHGRVDIEDQPCGHTRLAGHLVQNAIVKGAQLWQSSRGHSQEEPPKRGRIGVARQAGQVLKHAVLPQQVSRFEPFEAKDHRIEHRQKHLAEAVTIVPLNQSDLSGEAGFEANPRQEPMQEVDAAVMRQRRGAKPDRELPRSSGHRTESYRFGSFRSSPLSSILRATECVGRKISRWSHAGFRLKTSLGWTIVVLSVPIAT